MAPSAPTTLDEAPVQRMRNSPSLMSGPAERGAGTVNFFLNIRGNTEEVSRGKYFIAMTAEYGRYVNPISISGAHYALHINTYMDFHNFLRPTS